MLAFWLGSGVTLLGGLVAAALIDRSRRRRGMAPIDPAAMRRHREDRRAARAGALQRHLGRDVPGHAPDRRR